MKFSLLVPTTFIAVLFTQMVFADPVKSDICPNVDAIKQVGFNKIFIDQNGWLARYTRNKYDTHSEWTFTLQGNGDEVRNENEARQKAMQELQTLTFVDGPIFIKSNPSYTACIYKTNKYHADTRTAAYFI